MQVVLLPTAAGICMRRLTPNAVNLLTPFMPVAAVMIVAMICGSVIAQNVGALRVAGARVVFAVVLLHVGAHGSQVVYEKVGTITLFDPGGFAAGYHVSKAMGVGEMAARTNSIEVWLGA